MSFDKIFKVDSVRYAVNGRALYNARMDKHVTQAKFAELCDWSPTYQWKLENERLVVSQETVETLKSVLETL